MPEEHLNPLKDVDGSIFACLSILSYLRGVGVTMAHMKLSKRILTEKRTLIPANMTFAGENIYQIDIRVQISDNFTS